MFVQSLSDAIDNYEISRTALKTMNILWTVLWEVTAADYNSYQITITDYNRYHK